MKEKNEAFKSKVAEYLMDPSKKNKIIDYLLSIKSFKSFEDWEIIIKTMFNIEEITKSYPNIIIDKIELGKNSYGVMKVTNSLISYLKEESDIEKDFQYFFYQLHQQFKHKEEETLPQESVKAICNRRLERYCNTGINIETAFSLFYSCWDYVDNKNIVHITNTALKLMRVFIDKVPQDYLNFIIRPKYMPAYVKMDGDYYSFVFEPYTENIFEDWAGFRDFLEKCKGVVDEHVLNGIIKLLTEYSHNRYQYIPIKENDIELYGSLIRKWLPKK